jgi:hypothetical protein
MAIDKVLELAVERVSAGPVGGTATYTVLHAALAIAELGVWGEVDYPVGCVFALERAPAAEIVGIVMMMMVFMIVMMVMMMVPVSDDSGWEEEWNGGKGIRRDLHGQIF